MTVPPAQSLDPRGLPVGYDFNAQWEVTPRETKRLLDEKADFVLIDCRLPPEVAVTKIDGAELIPLQQIQQHAERLQQWQDKKIIVHCRSGGRSLQFAQILKRNGFHDVKSMAGGILLWNRDVEPRRAAVLIATRLPIVVIGYVFGSVAGRGGGVRRLLGDRPGLLDGLERLPTALRREPGATRRVAPGDPGGCEVCPGRRSELARGPRRGGIGR